MKHKYVKLCRCQPIMLVALCLMLLSTYYGQDYVGRISLYLVFNGQLWSWFIIEIYQEYPNKAAVQKTIFETKT